MRIASFWNALHFGPQYHKNQSSSLYYQCNMTTCGLNMTINVFYRLLFGWISYKMRILYALGFLLFIVSLLSGDKLLCVVYAMRISRFPEKYCTNT